MKKILSCTKAEITILLVTVLFLGLYAAKINAFRETAVGPGGYATIYTCTGTIIFAVAVGAVALALIELSVFFFRTFQKGGEVIRCKSKVTFQFLLLRQYCSL